MDEERREVLALLEGRPEQNRRSSSIASAGRSASPFSRNPRSPMRSPMQSILDYDDLEAPPSSREPVPDIPGSPPHSPQRAAAQPIRSMLDVAGGPPPAPVRSMLDIDGPSTSQGLAVLSAQSSPTESSHRLTPTTSHSKASGSAGAPHPRSVSDAAFKPVEFGPRSAQARGDRSDLTAAYQFSDIITSREKPVLAKRSALTNALNANAGKRGTSSMAEVIRGIDVSNLKLPRQTLGGRGRNSVSGVHSSAVKSRSPHNRLGIRSNSPQVGVNTRNLSPANVALLGEPQGIDMNNAYRRLSDAAFMRSGGSLSELPMRNRSDDKGANSGRLTKDYLGPDGEELPEDSSDDNHSSSSDEENERGRKTARTFATGSSPKTSVSPIDVRKDKTYSLLAAAEEEREFSLWLKTPLSPLYANPTFSLQVSRLPPHSHTGRFWTRRLL